MYSGDKSRDTKSEKLSRSHTALRLCDFTEPNVANPGLPFYPVNFTGILFGIDSFLATRNADHSALGEGVPS